MKLKLHNTSNCLIEVVTKAGLPVHANSERVNKNLWEDGVQNEVGNYPLLSDNIMSVDDLIIDVEFTTNDPQSLY